MLRLPRPVTIVAVRARPTLSRRSFSRSSSIRSNHRLASPLPASASAPVASNSSAVHISLHKTHIALSSPAHDLDSAQFDWTWLRDACTCPLCKHASTTQKLFGGVADVVYAGGRVGGGVGPARDGADGAVSVDVESAAKSEPFLRIEWNAAGSAVSNGFTAAIANPPSSSSSSSSSETKPPAHVSSYPFSFLRLHAPSSHLRSHLHTHHALPRLATPWSRATLDRRPPLRVPFSAYMGVDTEAKADVEADRDRTLHAVLDALLRDGFAFLDHVPTEPTGHDDAWLRKVAERIGEVRHTFYGQLWDVRSIKDSRNIAYTNLDLGFHMDLLYYQNPPRFQFLHNLRNKVTGGASIFVDAFHAARRLWAEDREAFRLLATVPVGFEYVNDGHHLRWEHPTLELAPGERERLANEDVDVDVGRRRGSASSPPPTLLAVNYSPPFMAPLPLHHPLLADVQDRQRFYAAFARFAQLTHEPEARYETTLKEGQCVVFDNRRVLHSRRGFEWRQDDEGDGDGVKRWLKGCYVGGDAVWDRWRVLSERIARG